MSEPLTPEQLAEIRDRAHSIRFLAPPGNLRADRVELTGREDLDALAALIGEDIPALLAEVERLRAESGSLRAQLVDAEETVLRIARTKAYTTADGRQFVFVDEIVEALGLPAGEAS
ncbi:hypothetical protein [Planobispora rosea]|uniref:hypothetical protein n=1 Tax=Planobispora rosea TaxID=35762 RepID=UPI00114C85C9|nr:hypothetical protein [Planobispora rosea]